MNDFIQKVVFVAIGLLLPVLADFPARADGWWQQLNPANAPDARFGHSLVQLHDLELALFGGGDVEAGLFNDLYVFSNNEWDTVTPTGTPPDPRYGQSMVTLPDGRTLLFGGEGAGGELFNDLFAYNPGGNTWTNITSANEPPPDRSGHSAAYTSFTGDHFMVAFGGTGTDSTPLNDTWMCSYYYNAYWWQGPDCPVYPQGAGTAVSGSEVYLLGQYDYLYVFDAQDGTWNAITQTPPFPSGIRYPAVAQNEEKAYLIGGEDISTGDVLNTTWEFDLATGSWTRRANMPVGLTRAGAAWYAYTSPTAGRGASSGKVILFGGQRSDWSVSSQTYEYLPDGSSSGVSPWNYDYDGDGTSDIAVFRRTSGLWSVRGITRIYFGSSSDLPVPGDYSGDTTTDIGIFRGSSGLWAIRGLTRQYFGSSTDQALPGDYNGDGSWDIGIFRETSGLWAIRGLTRIYFGSLNDEPVPGYYNGDGTEDIGIFRPGSGLWALRGISRIYFGGSSDTVVPGDYDGDGTWETAIFRDTSGLWAVRGVTRSYFGSSIDDPLPADYDGDGIDDIGIFRDTSGLWAIKGISRVYYGRSGDIPVTR